MPAVALSLILALRQLFDRRILAILLKSIAVSLVLFVAIATAGWYGVDALLAGGGLNDALFPGAGAVRGALSVIAAFIGLWLAWRLVAMAVIQFFADEVVEIVEARHYPAGAALARPLPLGAQFAQALRSTGRALLANLAALPIAAALLFTGVGTWIVFLLVNALLLGRELQDMVWLRHARERIAASPVTGAQRFMLGAVIAALLAVPFVNLLAPVIGAAGATHLVHRRMAQRNVA